MRNSKKHRKNIELVDNQTLTMKNTQIMEQEYIIPTKENPVFVAECDWFGFIEGIYKDHLVEHETNGSCGQTFALSYSDAVNKLHEWIKENPDVISDYPKCKFNLYLINGTWNNKLDQKKEEKVYSISASNAKRLLF